MSQGVNRLKELLFEPETQRLSEVQQKLDALAERDRELSGRQADFARRLETVYEQAGTEERLQKSVTVVIDGVLRDAEKVKNQKMSQAMAPLVVRTIKSELKNSQDEMVDALYPITGRLVKQYVQAAVADMMAEINRKLGGAAKLSDLEARAKAKGVTVAELVLAESQALKVDELFLIRRGSGDLVAHWERTAEGEVLQTTPGGAPGNNRDALIAGYLSGITSFSEEAFNEKKGVLRSLDLNGERIFVRASPAYLLAARCSGSAPIAIEQIIDDEFVKAITTYKQALDQPPARNVAGPVPSAIDTLLPDLAASFERRFEEKRRDLEKRAAMPPPKPSFARLYALAASVLLVVAGIAGWFVYEAMQTTRTKTAVLATIASLPAFSGYPVTVEAERGGRAYRLTGLAPPGPAKDDLSAKLREEVPFATGRNDLAIVKPADLDADAIRSVVQAEQARLIIAGRLEQASQTLQRLKVDLGGLAQRASQPGDRQRATQALEGVGRLETSLAAARGQPEPARLQAVRGDLAVLDGQVAALGGVPAVVRAPSGQNAARAADDIATGVERISAQLPLIERSFELAPLRKQVADLAALIQPPTPRQKLEAFARANAIFFLNGTDFVDEVRTNQVIDDLAALMAAATDGVVRVVGYTDDRTGPSVDNLRIAQARADRVAGLLRARRPELAERLDPIARPNAGDTGRLKGFANRRVEFEIAFIGEPR